MLPLLGTVAALVDNVEPVMGIAMDLQMRLTSTTIAKLLLITTMPWVSLVVTMPPLMTAVTTTMAGYVMLS